jgi:hypothetical protein
MKSDRNTSIVSRFGEKRRGPLALLFALMIAQTVLPISVGRAPDNQTRQDRDTLLARAERQFVLDVRQADMEYTQGLEVQRRLREDVLPSAQRVRDETFKQFNDGEADIRAYLSAQSEYHGFVSDYLKAAIRHRRGALALNTAIGTRMLP